tara:strand:+ start:921 stop:1865 length:945 start_codon:yes stop_codon:yes gene_type:complete
MPGQVTHINGILNSSYDEINTVDKNTILNVNGLLYPSPVTDFIKDKLYLMYDFDDQALTDTTAKNQAYDQYSADTGVLAQTGHDSQLLDGSTAAALLTDLTIGSTSVRVLSLDGVSNYARKRAYNAALAGGGGNHLASTYGVGPAVTVSGGVTYNNNDYLYQDGWTCETWWRSNGAHLNNTNVWSRFDNSSIRFRIKSNNQSDMIFAGGGTKTGFGTYATNTWVQMTFTATPEASTDRFTVQMYKNGQTTGNTFTNLSITPAGFTKDIHILGSKNFGPAEEFKGYYGLIRLYQKPLSQAEIVNNYIFNKARFGL